VILVKKRNFNVEYKIIRPQTQKGIPRPNRDSVTQVMESRSAVLGSNSEAHWNYGKIQHENGLKL